MQAGATTDELLAGIDDDLRDDEVMDDQDDFRLPPGRQPYDVLNGLRIGALVGGILGAILIVVTPLDSLWVLLAGAVIGGLVGYLYERRRLNAARASSPRP